MLLLAIVLPWVATRCSPDEGPNGLTQLAVLTACRPSRIVVATAAGTGSALLILALCALPMFVLVQQMSALPAAMMLRAVLPVVALAGMVAALAVVANVYLERRFSSWIVVTVATVVTVTLVPATVAGVVEMLGVGALATIIMTTAADRRLRYLSESE